MNPRATVQMTFMCNQDWDAMKVTACGRYCDVCKKEVIDFTKKSAFDYNKYKEQELCGRFLPEQVDFSLIKPIQFPFAKRVAIYLTTLFFSVNSHDTTAKNNKPATELVVSKNNLSDFTAKPGINIINASGIQEYSKPGDPFLKTKKRSYYWSKKFPFISIKRHSYSMGNIRLL